MTDSHTASTIGVMVLDDHPDRASLVEASLETAGFRVVSMLSSSSGLLHQIEQHQPDVILIDLESPDRDVLESLAIANNHNPTPIVMFSGTDDQAFVSEALRSGVTAYQNQALTPDIVKPIIDVAMNQFRYFESMRQELKETRSELEDQRAIERAKVLLARQQSISSDQAYARMRKISMDKNQRLADVARTVLAVLQKNENSQ
ncbi:MAG: ANTAR domain-containing protein [Pseudomonadota bacterium]